MIEYIRNLHNGQRLIPVIVLKQRLNQIRCLVIEREIIKLI